MPPKPKPTKQPKQKKRRPKTARQLLDAECMEFLKRIVRLRDQGCVTPDSSCGGYLTASHWQKRGKQLTRYDIRNVNCQCANHNGRHNRYACYYDAYMLQKYGADVCLELAQKASVNAHKWTLPELFNIRDALKSVLGLQNGR
jgi:hypothetical protein